MAKRIRRMSNGTFRKVAVVFFAMVLLSAAIGLIYWLVLEKNRNEQNYISRITELEQQLDEVRNRDEQDALVRKTEEEESDGKDSEEQIREIECSFITLSSNINEGDLIDIRIRYPDGSDYIVSSYKKVISLNNEEKKVVLPLNEEELLLLNSAAVDLVLYQDSEIYVTKYTKADDMPSLVDYLPSSRIADLLEQNPNIKSLKVDHDKKKRYILEEHLSWYRTNEDMEYEPDLWEGFVQEDEWAEYSREETPQDRAGENTDSESGLPSKYGGSIWD